MTIFSPKLISMEKNNEMIPIDLHLGDFKQYLDANSRCILSAKFGNGKSYFINKFIEKYSDEYLFIPIYPVNYQVMDNKDIFELIKRDILIRLLSSDLINVENINFSTAFLCYYFFVNNTTDTILDTLELIPDMNLYGIDIKVGNVIKKVRCIKEKYDAWKNEIVKTKSKMSDDYINHFNNLQGSIYEFDAISQLICDIIKEYKHNNPDKKVVLIIEDLDRIDPAHIFRILNVFSAHFDRYSNFSSPTMSIEHNNKFCLDKIVSVCDIENIKNIYSHVYGENTDFLGYISKFSNSKPFKYSLQEYLKEYIINHLLRKDLLVYTNICNILSKNIVYSMNKEYSFETNLRIIKSRIQNASNSIKNIKLYLREPNENKYIVTDSLFIYLLSLLNTFDFEFNLLEQNSTINEILFMIGKCWVLAPNIVDTLRLEINKFGSLKFLYITEDEWGYNEWKEGPSFRVKENGNELTNIDLRGFTIENNVFAKKFYPHISDIVSYLNKEAIININLLSYKFK